MQNTDARDPSHWRARAAPALVMAPASAWRPDGWMLAACAYSGVFATAVNNVLLARVTRRLGPTTANLYMPLQPLFTIVMDWLTLGDAVYLANVLCGVGVIAGLMLAVAGKQAADRHKALQLSSGGDDDAAEERVGLLQAGEEVELADAA